MMLTSKFKINITAGKKKQTVIDLDQLACDFHRMMIGSLAISPQQPLAKNDAQCKMAVLGLGGGLLTAYLVRHFKKVSIKSRNLTVLNFRFRLM